MIESPILQKVLAERAQRLIRSLLVERFGPLPAEVAAALAAVQEDERLDHLNKVAARCPDLDAFRRELAS